ncbi:MAG: hypothetical protein JWO93_2875, partial [Micrococcaceae bacterium]|nr:hypothetical protein [Micrococcaceae bacterium]
HHSGGHAVPLAGRLDSRISLPRPPSRRSPVGRRAGRFGLTTGPGLLVDHGTGGPAVVDGGRGPVVDGGPVRGRRRPEVVVDGPGWWSTARGGSGRLPSRVRGSRWPQNRFWLILCGYVHHFEALTVRMVLILCGSVLPLRPKTVQLHTLSPSLSEQGRLTTLSDRSSGERLPDLVDHVLGVMDDVVVKEPQDQETGQHRRVVPASVLLELHWLQMGAAIQLDN